MPAGSGVVLRGEPRSSGGGRIRRWRIGSSRSKASAMHCCSSRPTSWLTRILSVGGRVLRRRIGASVLRPSRLGRPPRHQRRTQKAVAVAGSQWIPRDPQPKIEGKFCTIVGGVVSPLLANVFLHYVVDLWVHQWRRRAAAGQVIIFRYADDLVLGCEHEADARRLLAELQDRLAQFGLSLHEGKTRLIEFGRFAAQRRAAAGQRRPETFDFLGFTHY